MRRVLPFLIFLASLFLGVRAEASLPKGVLFIDRSGNLMRTRAFPMPDNTGNQLTNTTLMRPGMADWVQTFRYDAAGRMTNTASPAGAFAYAYLSASDLITKLTLGSAGTITNAYDVVARLTNTKLLNNQPSALNSHAYGYNTAHQRMAQTNFFGNRWSYAYDGIGQLTSALGYEASGTARAQEQLNYGYDKAGNLMGRTNNGFAQVFTNDTRNQLTSINRSGTFTVAGNTIGAATNVTVNGGVATLYADRTYARTGVTLTNESNTFTAMAQNAAGQTATDTINLSLPSTINCSYDANGNLTNDGLKAFSYDNENQLVTNWIAGQWKSEFVYDGLGRRRVTRDYRWDAGTSGWAKTNEVRLLYDGMLPVQERGANNQPLVTYTRGLDLSGSLQGAGGIGGLLARTEHGVNGLRHGFYHSDGAGNVTAIIAPDGLLLARYAYDPFGNPIGKWGVWADVNVMRFSSKPEHRGMIDFGFRWYRSDLQRWLNQDPIGEWGGINLYQFVGNNPLRYVDPYGLDLLDGLAGYIPGAARLDGMRDLDNFAKHNGYKNYEDLMDSLYGDDEYLHQRLQREGIEAAGDIAKDAANAYVTAATSVTPAAAGANCVKLLGPGTKFGNKISSQIPKRGWTQRRVKSTIDNAAHTSKAINKSNKNPATAYFDKNGAYVVRDDVTGEIIQVSDRLDPNWVPDPTITNPPKK